MPPVKEKLPNRISHFTYPAGNHPSRKDVANLQTALRVLKLEVAPQEIATGEISASTTAAVKEFQMRTGLPATGTVSAETVSKMAAELDHRFYAGNKTRTQRLQQVLARLGSNLDSPELKSRKFGATTEAAVRDFQQRVGLPVDGRLNDDLIEKLQDAALKARLSSKTQVGILQRTVERATRIAKLKVPIDRSEIKKKELGATSRAAITAFQKKYGLPQTGEIDRITNERLESVAASRKVRAAALKVRVSGQLNPVRRVLRLNMTGKNVGELQKALAFFGHRIDEIEFKTKKFGKTTREAVLAYQRTHGLPVTGHAEKPMLLQINSEIGKVNPESLSTGFPFRVRGTVRDELWKGLPSATVQVWEKALRGPDKLLAERKTLKGGFFDVPYTAPVYAADGKDKPAFHLAIKVIDPANKELGNKLVFNPTLISWANFTQGNAPYRGKSEFETRVEAVSKFLSGLSLADLKETKDHHEITQVALSAQLLPEDVMRLALAHRAAGKLANASITAAVFYAFIRQNLPPALPGDLIDSTQDWTLIDQLVENTINGLGFMDPALQQLAFENAIKENLIPIAVAGQKDSILGTLKSMRLNFALTKPILSGNGNLQSLLALCPQLPAAKHPDVAQTFLTHGSLDTDFWADLHKRANEFGGEAALQDVEKTVDVGYIARNHVPTVTFLKAQMANPAEKRFKSARELAALTSNDWEGLIQANRDQVPDGTDGNTPAERRKTYANMLVQEAERLYPTMAFAAEVNRNAGMLPTFKRMTQVQDFIRINANLDLRTDNLDKFARGLNVPEDVLAEARVMQRVHRLAPNAIAGRALLQEKIHNSFQIITLGKENLVDVMNRRGVSQPAAMTIYRSAEFQYSQVLMRLGDYRYELHRTDPAAIAPQTYTVEEQKKWLGEIPNLETLFGSLEFCDCEHCQSVYGPPAYLADVLRFLNSHRSMNASKSVAQILLDRRPDIANIKLNHENTETAVPYIDLVCEVLESAIPAPATNPNLRFQTTRTAEELAAFPENVRREAYDKLKEADYPLSSSFNLWQEEARIFLAHLGVKCYELMEIFQASDNLGGRTPTDVNIAGEFFGISSHETDIIITKKETAADQNNFWGIDTTLTEFPVRTFLDHAKIEYSGLLDLLQVKWLNPAGAAKPILIDPPNAYADSQKIKNLSVAKFDQIHRFLRLWRHANWKPWELDLLIRAPKIGNGVLNDGALIRMKQFKQIQDRLGLPFEMVLCLYDNINTEVRVKPAEPAKQIQPLYINLFQNPSIGSVDTSFNPLNTAEELANHQPTLVAALAITESDLALLLPKTNGKLTLQNLTFLLNRANLARSLKLPMKDIITLLDLAGQELGDVFASTKNTLDFFDRYDWVNRSGFQIQDLDYVLNYKPDSPFGLRDETVKGYIENLRDALRSTSAAQPEGRVASHVAATFSLRDEQAASLIESLALMPHFLDSKLTEQKLESEGHPYRYEITPNEFSDLYGAYRLLHKVTILVARHKITSKDDLVWLLTNSGLYQGLDFKALPVAAGPAQSLFRLWLNLNNWIYFQSLYPEPEGVTWRGIVESALGATAPADVRKLLGTLTTWDTKDLEVLDCGDRSCYRNMDTYLRFIRAFKQLKRLGVSASLAATWAKRGDSANDAQFVAAQRIRQAAKSKYDDNTWLSKLKPLQDDLRDKKRAALVAYLIENSLRTESPSLLFGGKEYANPRHWKDASDLLGYFLIDVEMTSRQLTSRIKQAISAVQMFVQRCFLNLEMPYVQVSHEEQADTVSLDSWKQWGWMKSYRIWEANRKVFLYPENWIEPELRDDKSPFFKELENELLQSEITNESCEEALLRYTEKLEEVSRLEVVGIYHDVHDDNPQDNVAPNVNILHVVARTRSQPAIYYYRQFDLNYNEWTAWEKIDLDITSDHIVPVVYNCKLHLFWLILTDKPQKIKKQPPAKASDEPTEAPEMPKQLEIQLAWSLRKATGWSTRKVAPYKLIHPWERPHCSYNLKPRYKTRENQLWLDLYISTSHEFNDSSFYDPYETTNGQISKRRLTSTSFDETRRPWHSSSFVFDGHVVDVKFKPLSGMYREHSVAADGSVSDPLVGMDSYRYVYENFGSEGTGPNRLAGPYEVAPRLDLPDGMHYENTHLANNKAKPNPSRFAVLESAASRTVLEGALAPFEAVISQHHVQFDTAKWENSPFFYQDKNRAFFIKPEWRTVVQGYSQTVRCVRYVLFPFYHAYSGIFVRELNRSGVEGLLNRKIQRFPNSYYPGNSFRFDAIYKPNTSLASADATAQTDTVDFTRSGAFTIYNWELFFHAPLLIACKLSQNQRFDEAMRWFHYIFDPTNTEALGVPQRYWVAKPFFEQNSDEYRQQRIQNILENINAHLEEVRAWKNSPFKPHLIARYRPVAYQKTVVMKYIDNLIAWGDQLFRRDTLECLNEATLLYVLAYEMLGRRPVKMPAPQRPEFSYNELVTNGALDPFGNKRIDVLLENFISQPTTVTSGDPNAEPLPTFDTLYFAIPSNDKLLTYWDTVEDRLFKLRHGMNIEGVVRQLPLFEPPIDPALLVKAAASGVDLNSVLLESSASLAHYRFRLLAGRAADFCSEVRALGDKLLSVLERKDAEGLALLQAGHQIEFLKAVEQVRKQQITEAHETWAAMEKGLDVLDKRVDYYSNLARMNDWEIAGVSAHALGIVSEIVATVLNTVGGTAHLFPKVTAGASGFGGSPELVVSIGGDNVGKSATNYAALFQGLAGILHQAGQMLEAQGGYTRRYEENQYQAALASLEKDQLQKQIEAARIRYLIAEKELENQQLQIEQAQSADEYMRSKYTNQQLYDWMLKQIATVYFQSYQLAYDMAKKAERGFQYELGQPSATFIQFGYWDSLKKGLLAGERLLNDIRRMEAAYYDQNKRELEITKHVSLAQYMPSALLELKTKGSCILQLPEWLFDLDYPGHYRRRIKSVSFSMPCVLGPYANLNCTLSMTKNVVRMNQNVNGGYGNALAAGDDRFVTDFVPTFHAIASTNGQNDGGVFEMNLNDERYLPFEGAGVISEWEIKLPQENNQFDFDTISDLILHIRYTAVQGDNENFLKAARDNLETVLPATGFRLFSLKQEFGTEWYRFFNPEAATDETLSFTTKTEQLPFWVRARAANKTLRLDQVDLILESSYNGTFDLEVQFPGTAAPVPGTLAKDAAFGGLHYFEKKVAPAPVTQLLGNWMCKIKKDSANKFTQLRPDDVSNAYLLVKFSIQ